MLFLGGSGINLAAVNMLKSVAFLMISVYFCSFGALCVHDVFPSQLHTDLAHAIVSFDRNPLYLGVIFVAFLLIKALWVQLDISGEFRNGAVRELTIYICL